MREKELENKKNDLLSDLQEIVHEYTGVDGLPMRRGREYPPDPPSLYITDWEECRGRLADRLDKWVKDVFNRE